ncbi:MAG: hypothetical protein M3Z31_17135 [Pseudomonadota bacterium]|nr:hypothetical protein [Pseudomonadota bacterium]
MRGTLIGSILTIIFVGGLSAMGAWWVVSRLGLTGLGAAIAAVAIAMPLAVVVFAVLVRVFKPPHAP